MDDSKSYELREKFSNWFDPKADTYELILVIVFIGFLVLQSLFGLAVNKYLILLLGALSILYYLKIHTISKDPYAGGIELFIDKVSSQVLSVAVIGVLFKLQSWPGANTMLFLPAITLIILLPVMLYLQSKNSELSIFTQWAKFRILTVAALCIFLIYTPRADLEKYGLINNHSIEQVE